MNAFNTTDIVCYFKKATQPNDAVANFSHCFPVAVSSVVKDACSSFRCTLLILTFNSCSSMSNSPIKAFELL